MPAFGRPVHGTRVANATLLSRELAGPNGLAFSPDERFLYVDDWDEKRKVIYRMRLGIPGLQP
jgi:sugar lactone lactonase YvrE